MRARWGCSEVAVEVGEPRRGIHLVQQQARVSGQGDPRYLPPRHVRVPDRTKITRPPRLLPPLRFWENRRQWPSRPAAAGCPKRDRAVVVHRGRLPPAAARDVPRRAPVVHRRALGCAPCSSAREHASRGRVGSVWHWDSWCWLPPLRSREAVTTGAQRRRREARCSGRDLLPWPLRAQLRAPALRLRSPRFHRAACRCWTRPPTS